MKEHRGWESRNLQGRYTIPFSVLLHDIIINVVAKCSNKRVRATYISVSIIRSREIQCKMVVNGTSDCASQIENKLADELEQAGVILGEHYPRAIVDLKESRARALDAYKALRDQP